MKTLYLIIGIILITGCVQESTIKLTSTSFKNNEMIPSKYTCKRENINPPLRISGAPNNTVSYVLIMDDPDAIGWVHWLIWNIQITTINENTAPGVQGVNSWGKNEYGGPCPPSGTHHYVFKVYALDSMLSISNSSNKANVEQAIRGHVIAQTQIIGLYSA